MSIYNVNLEDRFHEAVELRFGEDLLRRVAVLRNRHAVAGIGWDQVRSDSRFEDLVQEHMDSAYRCIGQAFAFCMTAPLSAVRLLVRVESADV